MNERRSMMDNRYRNQTYIYGNTVRKIEPAREPERKRIEKPQVTPQTRRDRRRQETLSLSDDGLINNKGVGCCLTIFFL